MNTHRRRQPENNETNAARQARLRERRKALGFRRISLWLSPEHVDRLETLGGEPWLGRTVKAFLDSAVAERARQSAPVSEISETAALWREADNLNKAGVSWREIARQWNQAGRRTDKGAEYRGANIAREVRKWKQAGGTGE